MWITPPFGTDAEAVADGEHEDHQFGIEWRPTDGAVEGGQLPQFAKFDEPVERNR
jgi:hypothetical protein